jgi:hypothetical protein
VTAFSDEIDDRPTILPPLEMVEIEVGQFTSSETATEQDGNDRSVAFAFERFGVGRLPQFTSLLCGQPIPQPNSKFLYTLNAANPGGEFWAQQPSIRGFVRQAAYRRQPHVDSAWSQIPRFQVNSVPQHNGPIEGEPRFRTVPFDEFINGVRITTLRFRRAKAADHGGLGLIKIWKTQSRFRLSRFSLL